MNWIIMPVMAGPEMTEAAINDCLAQSVPVSILVINQGVDNAFRDRLERLAEEIPNLHVWHHNPPLPSLGASWNRALDYVWQCGDTEALVVNNDVRLHRMTYSCLRDIRQKMQALFVSAVGVTKEQFAAFAMLDEPQFSETVWNVPGEDLGTLGGPDFSCYLISRECHGSYRFDENFVPAFCEDLDYHRRLMLDGMGERIFSVNLPYLHLASQTLKQVDPQHKMKIERAIGQGSRVYYEKKWGGPVNQETFYSPFNMYEPSLLQTMQHGPQTPEIQRWVQTGENRPWHNPNAEAGSTDASRPSPATPADTGEMPITKVTPAAP